MGIVSVSDLDRLFWAGRYCERALSLYERFIALPRNAGVRRDFARNLGLMCDIALPETAILGREGAVFSALESWRANAAQLRHILGTRAVMQAEEALADAECGSFDLLAVRCYAFFGMTSDRLSDVTARTCVEAGRMCEKLDVMSRLKEETYIMEDALERLLAAAGESEAVKRLVSKCAVEAVKSDLEAGDIEAVRMSTPYLSADEYYS